MSTYLDEATVASDPGQVTLSEKRLRALCPRLFGWRSLFDKEARAWRGRIAEHLQLGDSRAALVVRLDPLLVAPYTSELDCTVVLRFPQWLAAEHRLAPGTRLLTVNTYGDDPELAPDLLPGPASLGRWTNFYPLVADFLSDDAPRLAARKREISEAEWRRAQVCADEVLKGMPLRVRDGDPLRSWRPATAW